MQAEPQQTADPKRSLRRRRWRWLLALPLLALLATVLQVLALRFVDPPFTAFMAARQLSAWRQGNWDYGIAYDWRDLDHIATGVLQDLRHFSSSKSRPRRPGKDRLCRRYLYHRPVPVAGSNNPV